LLAIRGGGHNGPGLGSCNDGLVIDLSMMKSVRAEAAKAPTELCLTHLYPIDGAANRVPKDATPWGARDAKFSMVIAGISPDAKDAEKLKSWGRAYWKAVHPHNMGGGYVNFMFDDEADGRVQAAYGDNYARLAKVKGKYDPKNLFRVNQNIAPA
jgi:FAD/FMN-containing dehydrogenase